MFLKPFRIRSQTSIKGSDRKKLRSELSKQYPALTEECLKELVPTKDEITIMKIYAHSGDGVIVYVSNKNPAFFAFEKTNCIFPTVYTLWRFPQMVEAFATWPPVFKKIMNGADLMLPGVITVEDPGPKRIKCEKGDPLAVKLLGNKAPIAIGVAAMSGEDMFLSGMRGKGVLVYHCFQDHLWAHGDKSNPPVIEDNEVLARVSENKSSYVESNDDDTAEIQSNLEGTCDGCDTSDSTSNGNVIDDIVNEVETLEVEGNDVGACGDDSCVETVVLTPDEMDELLERCFMCGIKASLKKSELPILTSKFFKVHMQPFCTSNTMLDVKKSRHKKLSKFLSVMQQNGYIKLKELTKGVESITEVFKDHPDVRRFEVPEVPEKSTTFEVSSTASDNFEPPVIVEMFTVSSTAMSIFKNYGFNKGQAITLQQMREVLSNYVKSEELDTKVKGSVVLDPHLTDLLVSKGEYVETLKWDELFSRCANCLNPAIQITQAGHAPVLKKGKLQPILLNIAQRAGNKKVTLVQNLELFGIDPNEFARTVQKGVACSTTCNQLPGQGKGLEVLVQGNQINYISQLLLEKYKLPRKYLSGLEKAPKKKKR